LQWKNSIHVTLRLKNGKKLKYIDTSCYYIMYYETLTMITYIHRKPVTAKKTGNYQNSIRKKSLTLMNILEVKVFL